MRIKNIILVLWTTWGSFVFSSTHLDEVEHDLEKAILQTPLPGLKKVSADAENKEDVIDEKNKLFTKTVENVHKLLNEDFSANIDEQIRSRKFYRDVANYSKVIGSALLYTGSGVSAIAAGSSLVWPGAVPYLLWTSTLCVASHVVMIGIARLGAREETERERLLESLANQVRFEVVSLKPIVYEDYGRGPVFLKSSPLMMKKLYNKADK